MRRLLAVVIWATGLIVVFYGGATTQADLWERASMSLGGLSFGAVGLLLAVRTPLVTGWLFLALQVSMGVQLLAVGTSGTEVILPIAAILLTFPDGRLPSKSWRWASWSLSLGVATWLFFDVFEVVSNADYAWFAFMALVAPVMLASAVRIVNDYRLARGHARRQLKWLAWVLTLGGGVLLLSLLPFPYLGDAHNLAGVVLLVGSPVAIGLAVTRYRLYEVDRVVSRTVSYTLVVALLGLLVLAISLSVGTRFNDPLVVAMTTLAIAALFNPVRKRVQVWVDRRFNRSKYDAEQVVQRFSSTLQGQIDTDDLVNGWVGVVTKTMEPSSAMVWIRVS
jgi:hypothetical protein